jgi:hypothetical protein
VPQKRFFWKEIFLLRGSQRNTFSRKRRFRNKKTFAFLPQKEPLKQASVQVEKLPGLLIRQQLKRQQNQRKQLILLNLSSEFFVRQTGWKTVGNGATFGS